MRKSTKLSMQIGAFCFVSLTGAFLFCIGCSVHETNLWGQSQDFVTFLLASGTYLSLLAFISSFVAFVVVLARKE
jgi:hypothetical protein